jgi:hypothetical protein
MACSIGIVRRASASSVVGGVKSLIARAYVQNDLPNDRLDRYRPGQIGTAARVRPDRRAANTKTAS